MKVLIELFHHKTFLVTINRWTDGRVILGPNLHDVKRPCAAIAGSDQLPARETLELDAEGTLAGRYVREGSFCGKCFHPNRSKQEV
jgi:hypothetical protein